MGVLFWLSICFVCYTYVGYPILLWVWARLFPKKVNKRPPKEWLAVSVVLAARNEERHIRNRIENILTQRYPACRLEVIVVSDGSEDKTAQIVSEIRSNVEMRIANGSSIPRITLISYPESMGKAHALNVGVATASGEIIVFTDARQMFEKNTIEELVANFSDDHVGCVSGELRLVEAVDSSIRLDMAAYWRFEKRLREMESLVHSVPGATGAVYAIRKSLYAELPQETLLDDVLTPMRIVAQGKRCILDRSAIAYDTISKDTTQEKRRKIRTLAGNWQMLRLMPQLVVPVANPIFVQYLSHKVFRLGVPFAYLIALCAALIADGKLYAFAAVGLLIPLFAPIIERFVSASGPVGRIFHVVQTVVALNFYVLLASFVWMNHKKRHLW